VCSSDLKKNHVMVARRHKWETEDRRVPNRDCEGRLFSQQNFSHQVPSCCDVPSGVVEESRHRRHFDPDYLLPVFLNGAVHRDSSKSTTSTLEDYQKMVARGLPADGVGFNLFCRG
jgi:hypothetical protein